MKALKLVILVLLVILTTGCSEKEGETPTVSSKEECKTPTVSSKEENKPLVYIISGFDLKPGFKIVSIGKNTDKDSKIPSFIIVVKNIGDKTSWNVKIVIQAFKNDIIIDTAISNFAGGQGIMPGEKAKEKAFFHDLNSHNDYDYATYTLQ